MQPIGVRILQIRFVVFDDLHCVVSLISRRSSLGLSALCNDACLIKTKARTALESLFGRKKQLATKARTNQASADQSLFSFDEIPASPGVAEDSPQHEFDG